MPDLSNDSYRINGFDRIDIPIYDENGNPTGQESVNTINITYKVWDKEYTQNLMNLPFEDAEALQEALSGYVTEAKRQLKPVKVNLPTDVTDLIDQTLEA